MRFNPEDVTRYFEFLSQANNTEVFTLTFLKESEPVSDCGEPIANVAKVGERSKGPIKGFGCFFANLADLHQTLLSFPEQVRASLHTTLNRTSLRGRKLTDVESPRVFCVDLDHVIERHVIQEYTVTYSPGMVVESSPGKYHLYWLIGPEWILRLQDWAEIQLGLASGFSADKALAQLSHTIRVPGVPRTLKSGEEFVPRVVYLNNSPIRHTADTFNLLFPLLKQWIKSGKSETEASRLALREMLRDTRQRCRTSNALGGNTVHSALGEVSAAGSRVSTEVINQIESRNCALYAAAKQWFYEESRNKDIRVEELYSFARGFNAEVLSQHRKGPLTGEEVREVVVSAFKRTLGSIERRERTIGEEQRRLLDLVVPVEGCKQEIVPPRARYTNGHAVSEGIEVPEGAEFLGGYDLPSQSVIDMQGAPQGEYSAGISTESPDPGRLADITVEEIGNEPESGPFEYNREGLLAVDPFSDAAVAERVFQRFGAQMKMHAGNLYCYSGLTKMWLKQGHKRIQMGELEKFVAQACRDVLVDPEFVPVLCVNSHGEFEAERAQRMRWKYLSSNMQIAIVNRVLGALGPWWADKVAESESELAMEFDWNPEMLRVGNGIVSLRDGKLREAVPQDYNLRQSEVVVPTRREYSCPGWLEFLSQIFADNNDPQGMIEFLQRVFGYSLSGSIRSQKLFIHYGGGANGKSKVLEMLRLLGGSFTGMLDGSLFLHKADRAKAELARKAVSIEGRRTIIIDDIDSKTQWEEGVVKLLTSDLMSRRRLYEEEETFRNTAKFHLGCNEAPEPETENFGLLRRLCIIPYRVQFVPSAQKDKELNAMMVREAGEVLRWAIEGYQKYLEIGLGEPDEVNASTEDYAETHFTGQHALRSLLETGGEDIPGSECVEVSGLLKEVNERLQNPYNRISFGMALSTVLKCKIIRKRIGSDKRCQSVWVIRKYAQSTPVLDLI